MSHCDHTICTRYPQDEESGRTLGVLLMSLGRKNALSARSFPQENVVKQMRVGVSATYAYARLGSRVRDYNQDA